MLHALRNAIRMLCFSIRARMETLCSSVQIHTRVQSIRKQDRQAAIDRTAVPILVRHKSNPSVTAYYL